MEGYDRTSPVDDQLAHVRAGLGLNISPFVIAVNYTYIIYHPQFVSRYDTLFSRTAYRGGTVLGTPSLAPLYLYPYTYFTIYIPIYLPYNDNVYYTLLSLLFGVYTKSK